MCPHPPFSMTLPWQLSQGDFLLWFGFVFSVLPFVSTCGASSWSNITQRRVIICFRLPPPAALYRKCLFCFINFFTNTKIKHTNQWILLFRFLRPPHGRVNSSKCIYLQISKVYLPLSVVWIMLHSKEASYQVLANTSLASSTMSCDLVYFQHLRISPAVVRIHHTFSNAGLLESLRMLVDLLCYAFHLH